MKTTVKFFALGKDLTGRSVLEMEFPEQINVDTLIRRLKEQFPRFAELNAFLVAVNMEYAEMSTMLQDGDEVAIIPPVSGG